MLQLRRSTWTRNDKNKEDKIQIQEFDEPTKEKETLHAKQSKNFEESKQQNLVMLNSDNSRKAKKNGTNGSHAKMKSNEETKEKHMPEEESKSMMPFEIK